MARPLRIAVAGGWYHVTSRGLNRQAIFRDTRDQEHLLEIVSEVPERFGLRLHAYVFMTNHYHLIAETPRANLSAAIQWLNLSYSVWFNLRHGRLGPVFNRPFKSVLVDGEGSWALDLSRYVHLNPIRLRALGQGKAIRAQEQRGVAPPPTREQTTERLKRLRAHSWSSYPAYAGYRAIPDWLTCNELWGRAATNTANGARAYRAFIEDYVRQGQEESLWDQLQAGMALGGAAFMARTRGLVKGNRREQPHVHRWDKPVAFESVIQAAERVKKESWTLFRDRHGDPGLGLVLWLARRRCGLSLAQLGNKAGGMTYAATGAAISRFARRLPNDPKLRLLAARVEREIANLSQVEMSPL